MLEPTTDLPDRAKKALDRARQKPLSYSVTILRTPDRRPLVVLGEAHMKLAEAAEIGKEVVASFELRGVETFQRDQVTWGKALGVVISGPRQLLRLVTFGAVKGSTITDAKQLPSGYTVELERAKTMPLPLHVASVYMTLFFTVSFAALFVPLLAPVAPPLAAAITAAALFFQAHMLLLVPAFLFRRFSWCWLLHPFLGILGPRDRLMVAGTVRMFADHKRLPSAVVVMGRAHVAGYTKLLVEEHGYARE